MPYIDGFVLSVPPSNKEAFRRHAAEAATLSRELGCTRHVETWGDDVPEGTVIDFRRAVAAEGEEVVVFSWLEYPDKAARDAAVEAMRTDPRMGAIGASMPFDGKRMIYGGCEPILDV